MCLVGGCVICMYLLSTKLFKEFVMKRYDCYGGILMQKLNRKIRLDGEFRSGSSSELKWKSKSRSKEI